MNLKDNTQLDSIKSGSIGSSLEPSTECLGLENDIYKKRFSDEQEKVREITWQVLCNKFFSRWISSDDTVLDLGAGDGLFIRNIKAGKKIAVDLSPHVLELENQNIEVKQILASEMSKFYKNQVDVVFMSNFLEHLPSKSILLDVLKAAHEVLKPGAKVVILQPNIRYAKAAYWDYIDHHIALTEHSLEEALTISGFQVDYLIPKFLPYTAKSKAGSIASKLDTKILIENYIKWPILWKIFGAQTFVVAKKVDVNKTEKKKSF